MRSTGIEPVALRLWPPRCPSRRGARGTRDHPKGNRAAPRKRTQTQEPTWAGLRQPSTHTQGTTAHWIIVTRTLHDSGAIGVWLVPKNPQRPRRHVALLTVTDANPLTNAVMRHATVKSRPDHIPPSLTH